MINIGHYANQNTHGPFDISMLDEVMSSFRATLKVFAHLIVVEWTAIE